MSTLEFRPVTAWSTIALATLLYVVFLTVTAPASVTAWAVSRVSGGMFRLEGVSDGAWNGQANTLVVSQNSVTQRFNRLRWSINGGGWYRGELKISLSIDDPDATGQAVLAWRPGVWRLSATAFDVAAAAVASCIPVLLIINPRGRLLLRTENLAVGNDDISGMAELEWRNASSVLSRVEPLGTYRAKAKGAGDQAQFEVDTLKGALQVAGRGTWSRTTGLRFDGSARAGAGSETDLRDLLRLFGPEAGDEVYRIRIGP